MPVDIAEIESRLARIKGRESRTQSVATRFTREEEKRLRKRAEAGGQNLREWARGVLLREVNAPSSALTVEHLMTEIVGLQIFLTHVLASVACGEPMTADQYEELMQQVRANKRRAAQEVIARHLAGDEE